MDIRAELGLDAVFALEFNSGEGDVVDATDDTAWNSSGGEGLSAAEVAGLCLLKSPGCCPNK